jgi:integrase
MGTGRGDGIYTRGRKLWMVLYLGPYKSSRQPTPFLVGQEEEAKRYRDGIQERLEAGAELKAKGADTTVEGYGRAFLDARTTKDKDNDGSLLKTWVYPLIGSMEIPAVRARHIKTVTDAAKAEKRAPKTVRNIYSIMQALFREAQIGGLIEQTPCVLREAHLGKIRDAKKGWRALAVFTRDELEALISDPKVPQDRRVLYALAGLGCLRHGEAAGMRWTQLGQADPLGRMTVLTSYDTGDTKTGEEREMPLHPVLAAMLAEWKLTGWAEQQKRRPEPADLVVPHSRPTNHGPRVKFGGMRSDHDSYKRLRIDCDALGLRRRRFHDLRRTGITLYREDGADRDILRRCTHGASADMIERYTSFEWARLCAQVSCGKVQRRAKA